MKAPSQVVYRDPRMVDLFAKAGVNLASGGVDLASGATASASYTSGWEDVEAINDGIEPTSSADSPTSIRRPRSPGSGCHPHFRPR